MCIDMCMSTIHMSVHISIHICVHKSMHTYPCTHIHAHISIHTYIYMSIHMSMHIYPCTCPHGCLYTCLTHKYIFVLHTSLFWSHSRILSAKSDKSTSGLQMMSSCSDSNIAVQPHHPRTIQPYPPQNHPATSTPEPSTSTSEPSSAGYYRGSDWLPAN